jgi:hypothetical protein
MLDAFHAHEKSFAPSLLSPPDARMGRWILLYATLQILSTLSVDTVGLKYSDKIRYFACPSLEGCPPWRSATSPSAESTPAAPSPGGAGVMQEARQTSSYCWIAPARWRALEAPGPNRAAYEMNGLRSPQVGLRGMGSHQSLSELDGRGVGRQFSVRGPVVMASSKGPSSLNSTPEFAPATVTPRLKPVTNSRVGSPPESYVLDTRPDVPTRNPRRDSPGGSPGLNPLGKGYEYRTTPNYNSQHGMV